MGADGHLWGKTSSNGSPSARSFSMSNAGSDPINSGVGGTADDMTKAILVGDEEAKTLLPSRSSQ